MNAPPPPPPPPPAAPKAPIPSSNKALLSSIEKGTKLKKVPDSLKNDRSTVTMSGTSSKNAPQMRPMNGASSMSSIESKQPTLPPNFSSIKNELANHISMSSSNLRKPVSNPVVRPPLKSSVPAPNQFTSSINKPPPPPPMNKKPSLVTKTNSISEDSRLQSISQNAKEPVINQKPVSKKPQPLLPYQHNSNIQPKSQVTRVTSNPPPPLSNSHIEVSKVRQQLNAPPPVPQRVPNQSTSGSPQPMQNRSSSYVSQYKVFDRPPPPPPPSNASIANNQRYSSFDRRFAFPDEKNFPNLKRFGPSQPGSRFSQSFSIETNSY